MRCELSDVLLHFYFDDELSEHHAAQYERHLQYCVDCSVALVEQELLSHRLELPELYQRAPGALTRKIRGDLRSISLGALSSPRLHWQWLAAASAFLLILVAVSKVSLELRSRGYEAEIAGEIVDMHRHSLLQRPTKGIASNNEAVIRQWFGDRLNFDLPIRNLEDEGFALKGGHLCDIEGRSVAAVVYEGRGNLINVFMWPTTEPDTFPRTGSRRGYQWIYWRKHKVEFCVVSDAARSELEWLYRLISE